MDWDSIADVHDTYKNKFTLYDDQRECKLIDDIIQAIQQNDVQHFKDRVAYFDKISRLDPWTTNLLLEMEQYLQNRIHAGPNEDELFNNDDQKTDKHTNINLLSNDDNTNSNNNIKPGFSNNNNDVSPPNVDEDFDGAPDADLL